MTFKKTILLFYGLFSEEQSYDWIPYSPLFIYARLKAAGFNPIIIHEYKDRDYEPIFKKYKKDTLLFGVSAMTGYQIKSALKAISTFKKHANYQVPVIWGGAHATAMPRNTLENKHADYVCVGPARNNLEDFAKELQKGKAQESNFPHILSSDYFSASYENRYYGEDSKYDLSNFPSFCFDDFDFSYLLTDNLVLSYTASVGCPGTCTFCSWGSKRHPWSALPLKRVLDDIEYLVKRYRLKSIWFADSELSISKDYLLSLAQGIIDRKLNIYWRCNARVMELGKYNKTDFALLEKSGLDRFFLGIENMNLQVQKIFRKIIKAEFVYNILEKIKDFDIQVMMAFIFGNPEGPLNDLEENREFLSKCQKINQNVKFQIGFYTPYPGTPMADLAESNGYIAPQSLVEYSESPFFLDVNRSVKARIPWFTAEDSTNYIKRFYRLFPKIDSEPEWNWRGKVRH